VIDENKLLSGTRVAAEIKIEVADRVRALAERGVTPRLGWRKLRAAAWHRVAQVRRKPRDDPALLLRRDLLCQILCLLRVARSEVIH